MLTGDRRWRAVMMERLTLCHALHMLHASMSAHGLNAVGLREALRRDAHAVPQIQEPQLPQACDLVQMRAGDLRIRQRQTRETGHAGDSLHAMQKIRWSGRQPG